MDSLIETIKAKVNVVDEIEQTVVLHKSGKSLKGLCPFHNERTPSFYVFPQTQTWRCFGCNEGGDVFSFVQKQQNLEFRETLRYLAEKAGVPFEEHSGYGEDTEAERVRHAQRERLRKLNEEAQLWFHQMLLHAREAGEARGYVQSRGISTETVIAFGLGYAPDSWDALTRYLRTKGYTERELVIGGLARARDEGVDVTEGILEGEGAETSEGAEDNGNVPGGIRDYFRNRLIFPIRDMRGHVIGFGGRALGDSKPKYLNSPQTTLFEKNTVLYAIDMAKDAIKQAHQVVIVEGYVDAVIAHQYGTKQTVACIGSAITEGHIQQLKKLTRQVTLALDPDAAGSAATEHGIQEAMKGFDSRLVPIPMASMTSNSSRVKNRQGSRGIVMLEEQVDAEINIMRLPDGEDPDEVIRRDYATWLYAVEHPMPLIDYYFETKTENLNLREPGGKAEAARQLLPVIGMVRNRIKRDDYVRKLAKMLRVEERTLHEELQHMLRGQRGITATFTETMGTGNVVGKGGGKGQQGQQGRDGKNGQRVQGDSMGQEYHEYRDSEENVTNSEMPNVSIDRSGVDKIQWEDYLIGLLLQNPGLSQYIYGIIEDGNFTGTDTRELYRILNSFYQRDTSPSYQSLEQTVPAVLHSALGRALKRVESEPPQDGAGQIKVIVQCAKRLKRLWLVQQNKDLQYLMDEARTSGDISGEREFRYRLGDVYRQIRTLDTSSSLQG